MSKKRMHIQKGSNDMWVKKEVLHEGYVGI